LVTDVSGVNNARQGKWTKPIKFAGLHHEDLSISEHAFANLVGLKLLSHYNFTLDFRNDRLLLDRRTSPPPEKRRYDAGIRIWHSDDGRVVVYSVSDGPAAKLDIQPNDELVQVDGKAVKDLPLWRIRELLRSDTEHTVPLMTRRGDAIIKLSIVTRREARVGL
jgi:predicted metalloprotease with PDZ domain